ncbi:ATG8-interacting protein 2 isoform X5 [Phoenix dactylifera]|uniref:ATG8-interacting protein 2 isoform X5 n=1 Tax=Phoenix dactylifera TaxID=42345 RepID=A0A8B7CZP7_PHODC|nr:ATG8-interacting protein 2 isoform X5 [Phoenix dactylifera]XP_008810137.2 ATG8-interacting protein 2 isoform X5 [Phoenix dactylifera]
MADDEKEREGTPSRGAEWEVVSLTASTYAAAPGPKGFFEPADENKDKEFNKNESESSEGQKGSLAEDDNEPKQMYEENVRSKSDDIPHGIQYGMEYEEGKGLQELNLVQEEQEFYEHSPQNLESPPEYAKKNEENRSDEDEYGPPSEAWWKRHAASLYHHVKEANTFWSVCVAAALMGLVILGQQWQREKWQLHQLKWRFSINDEKVIKMLGPLGRFKDVLVGGHRRSIRDGAASATL